MTFMMLKHLKMSLESLLISNKLPPLKLFSRKGSSTDPQRESMRDIGGSQSLKSKNVSKMLSRDSIISDFDFLLSRYLPTSQLDSSPW